MLAPWRKGEDRVHSRKAVALAISAVGIVASASTALAVNLSVIGGHGPAHRSVVAIHGAPSAPIVRYQDVYDAPTTAAQSPTSTEAPAPAPTSSTASTGAVVGATTAGPPASSVLAVSQPAQATWTPPQAVPPVKHDNPPATTVVSSGTDNHATTTTTAGVTTTTTCMGTTTTTAAHSDDGGGDHHCSSTSTTVPGGHD